MSVQQCQSANPRTKLTNLDYNSAGILLSFISTIKVLLLRPKADRVSAVIVTAIIQELLQNN